MNPNDQALASPTSMVVLPSDQNSQGYLLNGNQVPSGMITPLMLAATPTVANGDTYYSNGTTFVRLPIGTSNQVLAAINGVPAWQTPTPVSTAYLGLVSTAHPYKIQFGQGTIVVSGSVAGAATAITYPTAFTTIVGAFIGGGGDGALSNGVVSNKTYMLIDTITNSTARAVLASGDGSNVITAATYYFNWLAIGY